MLVAMLCHSQTLDALKDKRLKINSEQDLSGIYYDLSYYYSRYDFDLCINYIDSARVIADKFADDYYIDISLYYKGICYNRHAQYEEALSYFNEALAVFSERQDTIALADITYQMALVHRQRTAYVPFLNRINQSLDLARAIGYDQKEGMCLNAKLIHFTERNMIVEAEEVGLASLNIFESIGDSSSMGDVYNNMGNLKTKEGKLDEAIIYHTKQHELNTILNNIWGLGYSHSKLGNIYVTQGKYKQAEHHLLEGLQISRSQNSPYEISGSLIKCGEFYYKTGDYKKALALATEAEKITGNKKINNKREEALLLISQIQESRGASSAALSTYKRYAALRGSTLNETIAEQLSEMETKYKTVQKEEEIKRLSLEDQLNQNKISQQRYALTGTFIGLSLLTFLLFRIFGQKKEIESKNTTISEALSEKETLLKEIHHRVKNNLQVVSSLLRIQSNETNDEVAIEALKEGQARVQSMSLIHQSLYQKDNLTGIRMKDYMEKLTSNLVNTYTLTKDRVSVSCDIDDINLDVETVVPLGLIINELISNALKYAFPNDRKGEIKVVLKEQAENLLLSVIDNGVGINNATGDNQGTSFGYGLIEAFCNKLDAEMNINTNNGTNVNIKIREFLKV